jgi:hypothetical protein
LDLSSNQEEALERIRAAVRAVAPAHLREHDTSALRLQDGRLVLTATHSDDPNIVLEIRIDTYGRVGMLCNALYPGFAVCFNDQWEPRDCAGDLDYAVEVLEGLLEGRVRSDLLWSGDVLAKSVDTLVKPDGTEEVLDQEYSSVAGLIGAIVSRRRTTSTISFC